MNQTIHGVLERSAREFATRKLLVCPERTLSFEQINSLADGFAAALQARGIGRNDVVTIWMENGWRWVACYFGILKAGATVNPVNVLLSADEVRFIIADCGAKVLVAGTERLRTLGSPAGVWLLADSAELAGADSVDVMLDQLTTPSEVDRDFQAAAGLPATIGYTSGTTGRPKGAVLRHRSIVINAAMTTLMHGRRATDVVVCALPCSHVYGNIVLNAAVACGMTLILLPRFDEEAVLSAIERHRATVFEGVPTMYLRLLGFPRLDDFDLSSLRLCTVGGQSMPPTQMREVQNRIGCPLIELWGMTELGGLGTTHPYNAPPRLGSIGLPLPMTETALVDPEDPASPVARGQAGELMIRGPLVMQEYYGDREATREAITRDGWLHTGDLVRQDEDGYLYVVDRKKDIIVSGGYKVYPAEVERVIAEHPAVAMSAVAAMSDELKGHVPRAFVVLKADRTLTEAELMSHCRQRLAAYKVPREVVFRDDLPRTSSGKILRRALSAAMLLCLLTGLLSQPAFCASARPGPTGTAPAADSRRDFSLLDTESRVVRAADLRGRWLVIYFGFTSCPDVCPMSLMHLAQALREMGPSGARFTPVFITVDPKHDTPAVMRQYLRNFPTPFVGLTGSVEQIAAAKLSFDVYAAATDTAPNSMPAHSSLFYIINPQGNLDRQISGELAANQLARFMRRVLARDIGQG